MKHRTNRPSTPLTRGLIIGAASTALALAHTSCDGLNLGKKKDPAEVSKYEKKSRGSLFRRAKNRNGYIDENIQTTRRDRYAAQNNMDFTLSQPQPDPMPAATPAPTPAPTPSKPTAAPRTPDLDLNLDPDQSIGSRSTSVAARAPEKPLRLPTSLDDDFPQPNQPNQPSAEPVRPAAPTTPPPGLDDDGFVPLQPKLPGAESIEPPAE